MEREFLESLLGSQEDTQQIIGAILQQHQQELADVTFAGVLSDAIRQAGGRNEKAVTALLDVAAIRQSEDPAKAAADAVQALKKEQDYLFLCDGPRYATGTGTGGFQKQEPQSLAAALKARFGK